MRGTASYYCCTAHFGDGLYAAAGPALRHALGPSWRGRTVTISANGHTIRVRLIDWCGCHPGTRVEKVIDLEPAAIARLDRNYRVNGVVRNVSISW